MSLLIVLRGRFHPGKAFMRSRWGSSFLHSFWWHIVRDEISLSTLDFLTLWVPFQYLYTWGKDEYPLAWDRWRYFKHVDLKGRPHVRSLLRPRSFHTCGGSQFEEISGLPHICKLAHHLLQ
ncbi:hypothetical protein SUGI_0752740 [Cryptomeria japonica]|nr:hypothetical protein SUGI_0752740 [Cryptomeria japonica]